MSEVLDRASSGGESVRKPRSLNVLQTEPQGGPEASLDRLFKPRSVAFVGYNNDGTNWASKMAPLGIVDQGYRGRLYIVSRSVSEFNGSRTYRDLGQLPEAPDLVVSNVPAAATLGVVRECAAMGTRLVHIFTSGFGETGEEAGRKLQRELVAAARELGVRLLGPNCPGVYCPESGIALSPHLPRESGSVAVLAQSGGQCIRTVRTAASRGVRFSKVVGLGNSCDLGPADFLEYFADDEATRVIGAYIEGIRDGKEFLRAASKAARSKPVVIHKGGHTGAGNRAASSHTGAMASTNGAWQAACRQSGAIRVFSIDELVDTMLLFVFLPPLKGNRVALVSYGGGTSVQGADDCEKAGLEVPSFPPEVRRQLAAFTPIANNAIVNPVDTQHLIFGNQEWLDTVSIIDRWPGIDLFIFTIAMDIFPLHDEKMLLEAMSRNMLRAREVLTKPAVVVFQQTTTPDLMPAGARYQEEIGRAGFPVFPTLGRAASALRAFLDYPRRVR